MQKCAVLKFEMFCLQSTKANGRRTLFEAVGKIIQFYVRGFMLYDVSGRHIISHIVVFDLEQPRRKSESTSYLTQLNKTKTIHFTRKHN